MLNCLKFELRMVNVQTEIESSFNLKFEVKKKIRTTVNSLNKKSLN